MNKPSQGKKKFGKKLKLQRETIRQLDFSDLDHVAGGNMEPTHHFPCTLGAIAGGGCRPTHTLIN